MANFTSTDVRLLIRFTDRKIFVVPIGGRERKKVEIPAAAAVHKEGGYVYFEEAIAARDNNEVDSFVWIEHGFTLDQPTDYLLRTSSIIQKVMSRGDVMIFGTGPKYIVVCSSYKRVGERSSLFSQTLIRFRSYTDHVLYESEEMLYLSGSGLLNSVSLNLNSNFTNLVYNGHFNGHVAGPGFDDIVNYFIKLLCMKGYDFTDTEGQAFCRELVLKYCYVALDLESEMKKLEENGDILHEIVSPSGIRIELGKECFLAPECLFDPGLVGLNNGGVVASLYDISESFAEGDEMAVLLCGYFTRGLTGFEARLQREVTAISDKNIEFKFQIASSLEQGASLYSKSDFPRNRPVYAMGRPYAVQSGGQVIDPLAENYFVTASLDSCSASNIKDTWASLSSLIISKSADPIKNWKFYIENLTPKVRNDCAEQWEQAGLGEHASVASFAKFTLDLLAVAAAPELLAWTQKATAEEIDHAQLSFAVASYFRTGKENLVRPGHFPSHQLSIGNDKVSLVKRLTIEGLVNETVSAVELSIRRDASFCTNIPLLISVFEKLMVDETSHSLLAWSSVYWLAFQDKSLLLEVDKVIKSEKEECGDMFSIALELKDSRTMVDECGFIKSSWSNRIRLFCLKTLIEPMIQSIKEKVLLESFEQKFILRPDLKFEAPANEMRETSCGLEFVCSSLLAFVNGRINTPCNV